jgi:hypothetical protein
MPRGDRLPTNTVRDGVGNCKKDDADSIVRLLKARLVEPTPSGFAGTSSATDPRLAPKAAKQDQPEMTPTPMVVGAAVERARVSDIYRQQNSALRSTIGMPDGAAPGGAAPGKATNRSSGAVPIDAGIILRGAAACVTPVAGQLSSGSDDATAYQPPRAPPNSVAPPAAASTFSVAPEYDPRAPTKPKVRRRSSAPPSPPPLLFGLDRMLVWGLILGGLFVGLIVVIVHQLVPGEARQAVQFTPDQPENAPSSGAFLGGSRPSGGEEFPRQASESRQASPAADRDLDAGVRRVNPVPTREHQFSVLRDVGERTSSPSASGAASAGSALPSESPATKHSPGAVGRNAPHGAVRPKAPAEGVHKLLTDD